MHWYLIAGINEYVNNAFNNFWNDAKLSAVQRRNFTSVLIVLKVTLK